MHESIIMYVQGGSNMTGTNSDLFTHKSSRSYLNHLVYMYVLCNPCMYVRKYACMCAQYRKNKSVYTKFLNLFTPSMSARLARILRVSFLCKMCLQFATVKLRALHDFSLGFLIGSSIA